MLHGLRATQKEQKQNKERESGGPDGGQKATGVSSPCDEAVRSYPLITLEKGEKKKKGLGKTCKMRSR